MQWMLFNNAADQFIKWKERNIKIYFKQKSLIVFDVIPLLLQIWSKLYIITDVALLRRMY